MFDRGPDVSLNDRVEAVDRMLRRLNFRDESIRSQLRAAFVGCLLSDFRMAALVLTFCTLVHALEAIDETSSGEQVH
jgi:hypothetical protein